RRTAHRTDLDDAVAADGDVGPPRGCTGTVDHRAAADQEVEAVAHADGTLHQLPNGQQDHAASRLAARAMRVKPATPASVAGRLPSRPPTASAIPPSNGWSRISS